MASLSRLAFSRCKLGLDGRLSLGKGGTAATRWRLLILLLVLGPTQGWAAGLQQTIGLLPDAASECYYVQGLVESAQATARGAERAREDSEAAEAAGDLRRASNKMTIASFVLTAATENWAAVAAALQAMESKHGALPACAVPLKDEANRERREALERTDPYKQRRASLTERMKRS